MSRALLPQNMRQEWLSDAEMTRFRFVTQGSDHDHVAYPSASTDIPAGVTEEGNNAAELPVTVILPGECAILKVSGTGSRDDLICPAVDGTGYGRAVPSSGMVYAAAIALTDWTDGEEIPVLTFKPLLVDGALASTGLRIRSTTFTIALADLTDGGGAAGTKAAVFTQPAGTIPLGGKAVVSEGFAGDTSAVLDIGSAGDGDLVLDNVNVFAAATVWGIPAVLATLILVDTALTATITSGSDFGAVTAGSVTVTLFYIDLR